MLCPFDGTTLQIVNRSGVEIDWCPNCKGVWLERGELDKLIDQAGAMYAPPPMARPAESGGDDHRGRVRPVAGYEPRRDRYDDDDDRDDRYRSDGSHPRGKKRKNLLSEIFDF